MPASPSLISQILSEVPGARIGCAPEPARIRVRIVPPELDAALGGGLACGAITEIFGGVSSGRTTLAHVLISAVTHAGEFAAWIDLPNAFDPASAHKVGVDLERMLWVSPGDRFAAVRAVEHILEAGGFRVVVLDLDEAGRTTTLPTSAWLRMNRAAAYRDAAVIVIDATRAAGSFSTLALETCPHRRVFAGENGPCPVFESTTISLHVCKYRFGSPAGPVEVRASTIA